MTVYVERFALANGLVFTVFERTRPYYGDYHRVAFQVVCDVPVVRELFASEEDFEDGKLLLGESVRYCRVLEKMAVPLAALDLVRRDLLAGFRFQAERYLALETFPAKLVLSEREKARKRDLRNRAQQ